MPEAVLYGSNTVPRLADLARRLGSGWHLQSLMPDEPMDIQAKVLGDMEILLSASYEFGPGATPKLKLLLTPGAGTDKILFQDLPPGAQVCNVFEHEAPIAEYVLAGMLQLTLGLAALDSDFRKGPWRGGAWDATGQHGELLGRTVGILGYGHIGREVARRCRAFGMKTGAITRNPPVEEKALLDWIVPVNALAEVLPSCDFLVISCPLTTETRGLFDRKSLALFKPGAVLVNVSRGEIVEESALFESLREGRLGGAVLDVWYHYPGAGEPQPRPARLPFWELDNVLMTPHASAWSHGLLERRWSLIADNLRAFARGDSLRNVVHPAEE